MSSLEKKNDHELIVSHLFDGLIMGGWILDFSILVIIEMIAVF